MKDIRLLVERGIVASRYGQLLGVACEIVEEDRVCIRLPYRADVTTVGDLVHGGAIASLVDIAATRCLLGEPGGEARFARRRGSAWIVAARRACEDSAETYLGGRRSAASRRELVAACGSVSAESPARAGLSGVTADRSGTNVASSGGGAFGQTIRRRR